MNISLELLESNNEIADLIYRELLKMIQPVLKTCVSKILPQIKQALSKALREEPEYASLVNGSLRLEFGIPSTTSVDDIVEKLANTATASITPISIKGNGLSGGFILTALEKQTMGGLIGDDSAIVITEKGDVLPWLRWLLYEGNKPIVKNYKVQIGPNPNSRTGMAIMVDSATNWRVPPAFAGTTNSNWVTRAVDRISDQIPSLLQKSFEQSL